MSNTKLEIEYSQKFDKYDLLEKKPLLQSTTTPPYNLGQTVNYLNVFEGFNESTIPLDSIPYDNFIKDQGIAFINYVAFTPSLTPPSTLPTLTEEQGLGYITGNDNLNLTGFKQEIQINENEIVELTAYEKVVDNLLGMKFSDGNISNNRQYRYSIYANNLTISESGSTVPIIPVFQGIVSTHWQNWSITELTPIDSSMNEFKYTDNDVWLFNLNLESGEQTQNIVRQEQQTLGQFNRYSQDKANYISGNVTALLGSQMAPASYVMKNGIVIKNGEYMEFKTTNNFPTSNERVDMLKAWRRLVFSNNPKILKDREGQIFLVTLTNSSNKPMDNVKTQPNTVSFTWTQIGDASNLNIIKYNS